MTTDVSTPHGARVYKIDENTILIKQTVKRGSEQNAPYVIDEHKEAHVDITDDVAISDAIRNAICGQLPKGK